MSIKPRNRKEIFLNALADGKAPNIEPRTREEMFLMEQAQRESKGTSWNDLTDKPFDVTTEMVEILPEQSVTCSTGNVGGKYAAGVHGNQFLELGKEYSVVINGKKTKVTAIDDGDIHADGENFSIINDSGTEVVEGDLFVFWSENYGETITLAIYEEQEVVKKLDPKFVDGGVVVLTEDDTKYTCNYSASELIKMYVENPGQLGTAKFVRRGDEYNLYVSYLTGVNCDPNGDSLMLLFNDMSIKVTPDSVSPVADE